MYDCDACDIKRALTGLDPANAKAWEAYQAIAHRLAVDLHMGGVVLQWALADCSPDEAVDLFQRVSVIYDTLHPPQTQS